MKSILLFFVLIVIFVVAITFGANNDQNVVFNYLVAQSQFRLSSLLAMLFGIGFMLGWLFSGYFYFKEKLKLSSTMRKLKKLQKKYDEEIVTRQKEQVSTLTERK